MQEDVLFLEIHLEVELEHHVDTLTRLIKRRVWTERNIKPSMANVKNTCICMKGNWEFLVLLLKLFFKLNFSK